MDGKGETPNVKWPFQGNLWSDLNLELQTFYWMEMVKHTFSMVKMWEASSNWTNYLQMEDLPKN